jgi:vitamin B12 transporter
VFGLNWQTERGESLDTSAGSDCTYCESRRNLGLFASTQGARGAFDWQLAARHDDNSSFGGATTGQAAAGWRAGDALRVFASVGQGFRAPNLNELYSPGFGGLFAGNSALDAERSNSVELGLDAGAGAHRFSARAFRTRVRDLIAFQGGSTFQAVNVARAAIDGLELGWDWRADDWRVDASATWQDARDEASGLDLLRRADRKAALGVERTFGAWTAGAGVQYASARRDFAGTLAAYTLADLRLARPLGRGWRFGARLDNAFDRDYVLASGFATPRRALLLGVDWRQE